ncbi:hypothetical protein GW931_02495 [archaeon]|nr:hypothetical protein [archaeon]
MENKEKVIISELIKEIYLVCPKNLDKIFNNEILVLINPFIYHGEGKIPENKYHDEVFNILFREKKSLIVMSDIGIYEAIVKTALFHSEAPRIFCSTELDEKSSKLELILGKVFQKIHPKKVLLSDPMIEFSQSELEEGKNFDMGAISDSEYLFLKLRKKYSVGLSPLLKNLDRKYNE